MDARPGALVLFVSDLPRAVEFYRAVGLPLEEEAHDDGPLHHACDVAGVHFALFPARAGRAPGRGEGGATMAGFAVADLDATLARVLRAGAAIERGIEDAPWGRRAVALDPDGRLVELYQPPDGPTLS